ncbi:hypothetical protein ACIQBJ_33520 [Kitasatospora sp. NPDC088391]|uniref:hypothetical protein n=1 Tax=Kitasatospora sp. NPDC088391 TaxID=3364074 RepID=UPI0038288968
MIEIETFLRNKDGSFAQVGDHRARLFDPDYVEGAIRICIDGVEIVGLDEWDYVDQLWAYIADMVPLLKASGSASISFPDQPIDLSFRRQGSLVIVSSEFGGSTKKVGITEGDFLSALKAAGVEFFDRMAEMIPENSPSYSVARKELLS